MFLRTEFNCSGGVYIAPYVRAPILIHLAAVQVADASSG